MEHATQQRCLQAPPEDGQTLVDPPRSELPGILAQNRRQLAQASYDVQGRPLMELAASARRGFLERAVAYTRQYRDLPSSLAACTASASAPLVLSGHQPQLSHPGVWYKNFVLGSLAKQVDGVGIHLLIDSDLCRSTSMCVPTGTADQPRAESVPFDQPAADMPYEERAVRDMATFESFADRVANLLQPFVDRPLIQSLWPLVLKRSDANPNLGLCLAQGRHMLEASWGNVTLELPQSAVCKLPEFGWFAAHVLAHLPRFWDAHNDALAEYRRIHRLRNRAQPVPDLAESDGWLEAPFWMWSADDPRRQPVFARQQGDELLLTDRQQRTVALALSADRDAASAAEQLADLAARGIKLRTRALATTLFARLCLGDLFLHGIGGAKYDQITDAIAPRFFGFALPEFATVSATLRLPIAHERVDAAQHRTLRRRLRDLEFHPENYVLADGSVPAEKVSHVTELVARKRRWLESPQTRQNARQRHFEIVEASQALQPYVAQLRTQLERQLDEAESRLRATAILESREVAFCLFPREHLEKLLLDASARRP